MENTEKKKASPVVVYGIGFFELLGILFIALKLCGVIDWSWWKVLLPIYGPIALWLVGLIIFVLVAVITEAIKILVGQYRMKKFRAKLSKEIETKRVEAQRRSMSHT